MGVVYAGLMAVYLAVASSVHAVTLVWQYFTSDAGLVTWAMVYASPQEASAYRIAVTHFHRNADGAFESGRTLVFANLSFPKPCAKFRLQIQYGRNHASIRTDTGYVESPAPPLPPLHALERRLAAQPEMPGAYILWFGSRQTAKPDAKSADEYVELEIAARAGT